MCEVAVIVELSTDVEPKRVRHHGPEQLHPPNGWSGHDWCSDTMNVTAAETSALASRHRGSHVCPALYDIVRTALTIRAFDVVGTYRDHGIPIH